jgi:hypothetical protein
MNPKRFTQRSKKDEDLADEIAAHLGHQEDANASRGLSPEEAHRQAMLKFGNPRSTGSTTSCAIFASPCAPSARLPASPLSRSS